MTEDEMQATGQELWKRIQGTKLIFFCLNCVLEVFWFGVCVCVGQVHKTVIDCKNVKP